MARERWERDERRALRRRRRDHRRRRRHEQRQERVEAEDELTPRERSVEAARRRGAAKARLVRSFVEYLLVVGVLSIFFPPAAWVVGIFWGLGLAGGFAKRFVEPTLRERWVNREVERELARTVSRERRQIEGEHSRRIEELSASIAHEIRNPITAAKSLVQQMGEDPASAENVDYAKVALDELDRV